MEPQINKDWNNKDRQNQKRKREWTGLFLLGAGSLLLAFKLGAPIPSWVFTWPMILIAVGVLNGFQHNFKNPAFFILIVIGSIFLVDQQFHQLNIHELITPFILICIGLLFIARKRFSGGYDKKYWEEKWQHKWNYPQNVQDINTATDSEFINSTSVFGNTKKVVLSKNFVGGDITCFMGGAELDLTQADIKGRVRIDMTMVFGGAKLIVPSNWDVKNEMTAVFGGIEDKRTIAATSFDPDKVLVIDGTVLFGGIEIRNF
jgi:predicted membrane protein